MAPQKAENSGDNGTAGLYQISIIMPVLNESAILEKHLEPLQELRERGHELILIDGGSRDDTPERARGYVDRLLHCQAGRARQLNHGARCATGDLLLFLHIDTRLPAQADRLLASIMPEPGQGWGRFDVRMSGDTRLLRVVAAMMNLRSRLTGIATGDQAIFIGREAFCRVGGFPEIELMEDVAISRRLKRLARPRCLRTPVISSSRRWERNGPWRTIVTMWALRLAYFLGASPSWLHAIYYGRNKHDNG